MDANDSSQLERNLEDLKEAMSQLLTLRKKVQNSGELRMAKWFKDVERKEREVDERKTKFQEVIKRNFGQGRNKLNKEVLGSLHDINLLLERGNEVSSSIESFMTTVATTKMLRYSHTQLEEYICKPKTEIGSGEFGTVYKAMLPDGLQVAVKVLKSTAINDMEKQFMAGVSTMSKTYHRNLARLYGFCFDNEMKALVYEYMEGGSLAEILDGNHLHVSWSNLYGVAEGTARALCYLHEHCDDRIIHRDIKPGNVLLNSNYLPKVTDFGLARLYSTDKSKAATTLLKRSHPYDAPEALLGKLLTCKCDVFSFGMMLFDILRRKTFEEEEEKQSFPRKVWARLEELDKILEECGIREKDKESARKLSIIAFCCIQDSPEKRPSMSTVLKVFEGEMELSVPPCPFRL